MKCKQTVTPQAPPYWFAWLMRLLSFFHCLWLVFISSFFSNSICMYVCVCILFLYCLFFIYSAYITATTQVIITIFYVLKTLWVIIRGQVTSNCRIEIRHKIFELILAVINWTTVCIAENELELNILKIFDNWCCYCIYLYYYDCSVTVIVGRNGICDPSSNPGRYC